MNASLKTVSLLATFVVCSGLSAQMEAPAKEVEKFAGFVGKFTGSGTASQGPDGPEMPWTSNSVFKKVLGGHFIREDTKIEFGEAMPPLVFRTFLGWDRENQRYVSLAISNMGELTLDEVTWVGKTLISTQSKMEFGNHVTDHWTTRFTETGYAMHGMRSTNGGAFYTHVKGTMKRVDKIDNVNVTEASAFMGATPEPMAPLQGMGGHYKLKGGMVMMPGMPEMPISGTEDITPVFGGTILEMTTHGDPIEGMPAAYEAWGAMAWDATRECFVVASVSNFGEVHSQIARKDEKGALVFVNAGFQMGQPMCSRLVMKRGEGGVLTGVVAHNIMGSHEPTKAFWAKYEKTTKQ